MLGRIPRHHSQVGDHQHEGYSQNGSEARRGSQGETANVDLEREGAPPLLSVGLLFQHRERAHQAGEARPSGAASLSPDLRTSGEEWLVS